MREANGTPYVYVVEDGKIAIRRLVTHRTQGQNWIVEEGLKPGEKVVIEGLQRILPGCSRPDRSDNGRAGTSQSGKGF